MTHQRTPSGIRAGARPPSCYGVMLAAKCGRASGLVRAAAPALTARAPGHIAPALVPRRLMVRLRFRSEEHTYELQSLMRISYAVFCLKKKNIIYSYLMY